MTFLAPTMSGEHSTTDDQGPKSDQLPHLQIRRNGTEKVFTVPLTGRRVVVGRHEELPIVLPRASVSRMHAEFVSDPDGRWWIHDLGSTNGTYVNGQAVSQCLLTSGDTIEMGEYVLRFRCRDMDMEADRKRTRTEPPPPQRRSTQKFLAVRAALSAWHVSGATDLTRELNRLNDRDARIQRLCEQLVGDAFPALSAWVIRFRGGMAPDLEFGPVVRDAAHAHPMLSDDQALIELCTRHELALRESQGPHVFSLEDSNCGQSILVTAPLDTLPDGADTLYVEFPAYCNSDDWKAVIALIAEGFQQANTMWEMRRHVRTTSLVDRELEMARQVQDGLIPDAVSVQGLQVAIGYEPCQWVGGDYVDTVHMADGRVLLTIADVCGKGFQASLVASSLHTFVNALAETDLPLTELVERLNRYLCRYLPEHSFVTMVFLALDVETGELECINTGHPGPLVVSRDGQTRSLQSSANVALGIVDFEPVAERSHFAEGEVLLLYTDGVIDAEDPSRKQLGGERLATELARIVTRPKGATLDTVRRRLEQTLNVYRDSLMPSDDTTFLLARRGSKIDALDDEIPSAPSAVRQPLDTERPPSTRN